MGRCRRILAYPFVPKPRSLVGLGLDPGYHARPDTRRWDGTRLGFTCVFDIKRVQKRVKQRRK